MVMVAAQAVPSIMDWYTSKHNVTVLYVYCLSVMTSYGWSSIAMKLAGMVKPLCSFTFLPVYCAALLLATE